MLGYEDLDEADPLLGPGTRRVKTSYGESELRRLHRSDSSAWSTPHTSKCDTRRSPSEPPYITLPLELWSGAWMNVLSALQRVAHVCLRLVLARNPTTLVYTSHAGIEGVCMWRTTPGNALSKNLSHTTS
ncbi:MAG: hypothetical protein K0S98_2641 [Propionibacteriaceae bacterium]|nr:hypothetical protein [Propionibacteriaceae bacterium]